MYVTIVEQLIAPILQDQITEIEIREIKLSDSEIEVIILAPQEFFKRIIGKNGAIIQAITTIVNARASMNDQHVKITLNEL